MPEVDYQRTDVARRYSQGRELPDDVLDRWGAAVRPYLPSRPGLRVLDLGAGTGIFARAWPSWTSCGVVAVEPAAGMRAELAQHGTGVPVQAAAGRAEQVPLRSGSVDVAWLSTVVHHLGDLAAGATEVRRVLAADGVVFVRGLFADLGRIPGLDLVPGAARAVAAFPTVATVESAFAAAGLPLRAAEEVVDRGAATVGQAAEWIRRMRLTDTLLLKLTDDEIAGGLATMDAMDPAHVLDPASLGLVVFGP
jgi:SAM-dependent methyltransferase